MREICTLSLLTIALFLTACSHHSTELKKVVAQRDSLAIIVSSKQQLIQRMRDSINMLSFPSDQRLLKIKELINNNCFSDARSELICLVNLFPNSQEARFADELEKQIQIEIEKQEAEASRLRALGFKAIKASLTAQIDCNQVSFSEIRVANTFTFDSYDYSYFYITADRGSKFVSVAMKVTSSSKDPKLPQLAVYSINGDTMHKEGTFITKFRRWKDYGYYLGNYHDNSNDFAKTSTINFKLGCELSEEILKQPYAIVLKKENALIRREDRFENPPVSYVGSVDYAYSLSVDDFGQSGRYQLIKLSNL
jgi:hypothetical protein